jgi:hypothetical protein
MGRTIPSFRIASMMEQKEWKVFRKSLNELDKKVFDNMFDIAHLYNSASSYSVKPMRLHPIFISIIFHHYKQLTMIAKQIEANTQKDPSSEPF